MEQLIRAVFVRLVLETILCFLFLRIEILKGQLSQRELQAAPALTVHIRGAGCLVSKLIFCLSCLLLGLEAVGAAEQPLG